MNVEQSDATLVFRPNPSQGANKTIGYCQNHKWIALDEIAETGVDAFRPYLIINDMKALEENTKLILTFLAEHHVRTLNVAGHNGTPKGAAQRKTKMSIKEFAEAASELIGSVCDNLVKE